MRKHARDLARLMDAADAETVINVALLLCGARPACVCEPVRLTKADARRSDAARARGDMATVGAIYDERAAECTRSAVEAMKAFPGVSVIADASSLFCYRPDLVRASDVAIIRRGDGSAKYHRAMGRALGYVGTAFPCNKHADAVHVDVYASAKGGRDYSLLAFCAFPSEVHAAILFFETFRKKASPVVGELATGLEVKDFFMRIGRTIVKVPAH